jgi:hypothetical protein
MVLVYLSLAENRIFALPYCTWCYILIRITYCRLSRQLCVRLYGLRIELILCVCTYNGYELWHCDHLHSKFYFGCAAQSREVYMVGTLAVSSTVLSILYYPDSNYAARMFALQFPTSKSTCHVKCKNTHLSDRHLTSTNHCSGSLCYTMYIFTDPSDKSPHTAFACNTQATAYSFYLATAFANETQISGWFSMLPLLHAPTYSISLP